MTNKEERMKSIIHFQIVSMEDHLSSMYIRRWFSAWNQPSAARARARELNFRLLNCGLGMGGGRPRCTRDAMGCDDRPP